MAEHSSPALVLRHLNYGEADRIITFFTPEKGRVKGFARHARNSRKRFGAALELFASVDIFWGGRQRGDLLRLDSVDLKGLRPALRHNLCAFALASYACELAELLLEEGQSLPELYHLLLALLDHLEAGGDASTARLLYELRLIELLGYMPHLLHCSLCLGDLGDGSVRFHGLSGGAICQRCGQRHVGLAVQTKSLGSLARCRRAPLTQFAGIHLGAVTLAEGGRVLQQILAQHWTRHPKSLDFLTRVLAESHS